MLRGNEESAQRLSGYLGGAIAVLVTSLALVHGAASAQAAPTLEPVPNQLANGASATTPGLAANTIEVALAWTGGEPGGEYPLRITWGDGVVENLTVETGPLVLQHTYPDTGAYAASARFVLPGSPVRAFDVTILDIPPEAEAMLVSPEMDAAQRFGQAIAFDGTRALVGSPREPGTSGGGRVHVFRRDGGTWSLEQTLAPTPSTDGASFGTAIAIDGDTIVVGARADWGPGDIRSGGAYIFDWDGTEWGQVAALFPPDGVDSDGFGLALALDGGQLAVGAPLHDLGEDVNDNYGAVYLYERQPDGTWAFVQKLTPATPHVYETFGTAIALEDGTLVVGADGFPTDTLNLNGRVFAYSWSPGGVPSLVAYQAGQTVGEGFGSSVAIDAGQIAVGAPGREYDGGGRKGGIEVLALGQPGEFEALGSIAPALDQFDLGMSIDIDDGVVVSQIYESSPIRGRDVACLRGDDPRSLGPGGPVRPHGSNATGCHQRDQPACRNRG